MINKVGYHATRDLEGILADRVIKPVHMPCVYLFTNAEDALEFAQEFGYQNVVTVIYASRDVENSWRPAYAKRGKVVRLGSGRMAQLGGIGIQVDLNEHTKKNLQS